MLGGLEWSIQPHKSIVEDRNRNLVANASLIELVGIELLVLGLCWVLGLSKTTMNTINGDQEDWNVEVFTIVPLLGPNNLEDKE